MRRPLIISSTVAAVITMTAATVLWLNANKAQEPPTISSSSSSSTLTLPPPSPTPFTPNPEHQYPQALSENTFALDNPCGLLNAEVLSSKLNLSLKATLSGPGQCTLDAPLDPSALDAPPVELIFSFMPNPSPYLEPMFSDLASSTQNGLSLKEASVENAYALIASEGSYTVYINFINTHASPTQKDALKKAASDALKWLLEKKPDPTPHYIKEPTPASSSTLEPPS